MGAAAPARVRNAGARVRTWLTPNRRDPTQVVLRRCAANLLDALLIAGIIIVVIFITGDVKKVSECPDPIPKGRSCIGYSNQALLVNDRVFFWFVFSLVTLFILVFVVTQGITGTSPGKAVMRIRVVRPDGAKPGWKRSLARASCWIVDGFLLIVPAAFWLAVLTPRHRRVGDYVANTYVVRREAAGAPVARRRPVAERPQLEAPEPVVAGE